jgi:hypothetical protein
VVVATRTSKSSYRTDPDFTGTEADGATSW